MAAKETPYSRFCREELVLRDHLATHRTVLANERTALAYVRTMLTFLIGGASFIQFFADTYIKVVGWVFIPTGLAVGAFGVYSYLRVKRQLSQIGSRGQEAPLLVEEER